MGVRLNEAGGHGGEEMLGVPARVVVVDDDAALRSAVRRALRLEGYDVELAGDGEEALARLAGARADLLVLDVLMPVLDGITVCRRLREGGDRTPILMLTARDAVCDRVVGLDAGADDYLTKRNAGAVLTRDAIRERVWGFDDSDGSNTLDVYVGYLRRKTEAGGEPRLIHTVRGVGFVLRGR